MNEIFSKIFRYIPKETSFKLFGLTYFIILIGIILAVFLLSYFLKNKSDNVKQKILNISAITLISLYIFDFFVQPFWAGSMIVHKLPFHICTAVGVLIPFVTFNKKFDFAKTAVTVWAVICPLIWIVLPMNVVNGNVRLYSYPIVQSYAYHVIELFWGVFMLVSGTTKLDWKNIWQPIIGLFPMALWATIGQELYFPDSIGENYMFLRTDTTGIVPHWLFIVALFLGASLAIALVYLIYNLAIKKITRKGVRSY
ncbi:MAG: YwaF family protein [Bacilli bacterium]|nr:YwaF family protein [Bacilli bacterium]